MACFLQHRQRLFVVLDAPVKMIDLADRFIIPDHIDEDLVHSCILQIAGQVLPDQPGVNDDFETWILFLDDSNGRDVPFKRNLPMSICPPLSKRPSPP